MDIRVMVDSEVRLYRDALQSVLRGVSGIALVGVASSAEEVIRQACMLNPSVAVVDMAMIESFSIAKPIARAPQLEPVEIVQGIADDERIGRRRWRKTKARQGQEQFLRVDPRSAHV